MRNPTLIPAVLRVCALLLLSTLARPAAVSQTSCAALSLIHTHGTAHTRLPNTVADVSVSIQTDGATVAAVSKALAVKSQRLLGYLREQHAERLATQQVSVDPKMHTVKGGPDEIAGYSGRTNVTFRAPIDMVSELITNALANGANTLDSVNFQPREEEGEAARRELAIEATKIAMADAEAVAKAAGTRVTSVREITVDPNGGFSPVRPMAMAQRFAVSNGPLAKVDTEAGDQEVSATVNLDVNISQ